MLETFRRAHDHDGAAFVEIYQNCNVFNDGAFEEVTSKEKRADMLIPLAARGADPVRCGQREVRRDRQRRATRGTALVAEVGEDAVLVHDEARRRSEPRVHAVAACSTGRHEPTPIGVFRAVTRPEYAEATSQQLAAAVEQKGPGDLGELLHSGATWTI